MWKRIIAGGGKRPTRLHDEIGNRIGLSRLVRNGPKAAITLFTRLAFDRRDVLPWISYDAQRALDGFLTPHKRVLEFGSGMSTAWYAARSAQVISVEDYRPWYDKVNAIFGERGIANVDYKFAPDEAAYLTLTADQIGGGFDLVMIDGNYRDRCVDIAIRTLKPGGWIYLDNADKDSESGLPGNVEAARQRLIAHSERVGGSAEWFTDFSPTQFFVQTGLLIRT